MTEVVGVRFKQRGKIYYFDPGALTLSAGTDVIVETARGLEYGECALGNTQVEDDQVIQPLRKVIRAATDADRKTLIEKAEREKEALVICQQKVEKHKLEMKFIDAEIAFDGSKILFYFTADGRIDFRDLVRDLASVFRTRIELRQIGVRDEAKLLGGLGICGKPFCCSTFLDDFQPVSIKMAKEQSLSLNPTKISGTCGRLMCCLKFEQDAYEDLHRTALKPGTKVVTIDGPGVVTEICNLLRGSVKVRLDASPENAKLYQKCEVGLPGSEETLHKAVQEEEPPFGSSFGGSPLGSISLHRELTDAGDTAPGHLAQAQDHSSRRNRNHRGPADKNDVVAPAGADQGGSSSTRRSHRHRGRRGHGKGSDLPVSSASSNQKKERREKAPRGSSRPKTAEGHNKTAADGNSSGHLPAGGYSSGYSDD